MHDVTLHLTDGRSITARLDEPADQFAVRWKDAVKKGQIIVFGSEDDVEYVAASQIVSVR